MQKAMFFSLALLITGGGGCWAQSQFAKGATDQIGSVEVEASPQPQTPNTQASTSQTQPPAAKNDKTNWHFEIGGSFASLNNNYGRWYGGDTKIAYTGSKYFTPMVSAGSQTRPEGTQQAYGFGSYVNFSKYAYAIVGVGFAPNRGTILFPSFRYDLMGVVKAGNIKGLLMTVGYTSYRMGGGKAKIASVGGIYYLKKVILNGAIAFNRSYPGNLPSKSGYLSFMTGKQGKHWWGAGVSGGNAHYQTVSIIPFDVRYNAVGFSAFYQKWLGRHWGITPRYYFTRLFNAYTSHSTSITFFYDF